jgi:hypothetical protein
MLPEAKHEDLMYVATTESSGTYAVAVFSYPAGKPVGTISVRASGICTGPNGDFFVTEKGSSGSTIQEYAHGGTTAIKTLSDPYEGAQGCSVDPKTGNLAVANAASSFSDGTVVVYPNASGAPTAYALSFATFFCAYDGSGDLFATGFHERHPKYPLYELVNGSSQFTEVTLDRTIDYPMGLQWDGTYLVAGDGTQTLNSARLRRYKIEGTNGTSVSVIDLRTYAWGFFIQRSKALIVEYDEIGLYDYPGGTSVPNGISVYGPYGVTVSVAKKS